MKMHSQRAEAALFLEKTNEIAMRRLIEKHCTKDETVQSKVVLKVGVEKLTDQGTAVVDWWKQLLTEEGQSHECVNKNIMNLVAAKFSEVMYEHVLSYGPERHVCGITIKDFTKLEPSADAKAPKAKLDIHRVKPADPSKIRDVMIPFWGKIVAETPALQMNKAMCLPIGDGGGLGPRLYVEGVTNSISRSDGCIAWMVPPIPKKKDAPTPTKAPPIKDGDGAEAGEEEAAVVAAPGGAVATLPASSGAKGKTGAKEDKKKKPDLVVTHIIDYLDTVVEFKGTSYTYQIPYLKNHTPNAEVYNVKCFRALTPWDEGEVLKKSRDEKEVKTFLSS